VDQKRQPGVQFGQIYLSELRFSHRRDALNLPHTTPVDLDRVKLEARIAEQADHRVAVLTLRVSTDPKDGKALYQFLVEMVATVTVAEGEPNLPPAAYLKVAGPATLFPFLREVVANLTMRGRFGPVWLKPFNFQSLAKGWRGPGAPTPGEFGLRRQDKKSSKGKGTKVPT
jgi:preprotein translocase subunit SecB